uniref:RCC1-like domain-containing protein n=1 Tax=Echeneis naucrates TaxID=173247 RepID=A0A665TWI4_ECHNA
SMFSWGENCHRELEYITFFLMGQYLEIFLFTDGQVYTWGQDSRGQLGLGRERPSANSPQHVKSLSAAPLVQIAAGGEQSFALSVSGAVFGWGRNDRGQLGLGDATGAVQYFTVVTKISCGRQHSVALTRDGQVYTWGQDSRGQLGLGRERPSANSPQHVKSLSAAPLVQIAAGGEQSFALSVSGAVFGWGRNDRGQLGLGDATGQSKATLSCSIAEHEKDGDVFTFGSSQYGQLGHDSLSDELHPRLVADHWKSKVAKIACGCSACFCFCAQCITNIV